MWIKRRIGRDIWESPDPEPLEEEEEEERGGNQVQ